MLKLKIKSPPQFPTLPSAFQSDSTKNVIQPTTQFLYFPFGPGFSSFGSQKLLQPMLQKTGLSFRFWNEPSRFRSIGPQFRQEKAFANWLDSAEYFLSLNVDGESRIVLVAHSFSALPILYLAKQHIKLIDGLVFVSPLFHPFEAYRMLLETAVRGFKEKNRTDLIDQIKNIALHSSLSEEQKLFHAIAFLQEQNLLNQLLWNNPLARENWLAANNQSLATAFDPEAYHSVWNDFVAMDLTNRLAGQYNIPIMIVMGDRDPMLPNHFHFSWHSFPDLHTKTVPDAGHFPHLEQTFLFAQCLQDFSLKLRG